MIPYRRTSWYGLAYLPQLRGSLLLRCLPMMLIAGLIAGIVSSHIGEKEFANGVDGLSLSDQLKANVYQLLWPVHAIAVNPCMAVAEARPSVTGHQGAVTLRACGPTAHPPCTSRALETLRVPISQAQHTLLPLAPGTTLASWFGEDYSMQLFGLVFGYLCIQVSPSCTPSYNPSYNPSHSSSHSPSRSPPHTLASLSPPLLLPIPSSSPPHPLLFSCSSPALLLHFSSIHFKGSSSAAPHVPHMSPIFPFPSSSPHPQRLNISYNRYWEGATELKKMLSKFAIPTP